LTPAALRETESLAVQMGLPFGGKQRPPAPESEVGRAEQPTTSAGGGGGADDGAARARLTAELAAALVRELRATYSHLNATFFKRKLTAPSIELSDAETRLGRWVADVRTIEISRSLVLDEAWGVVVEVLKHEMAHQFVHEVLGQVSEAAHGPAFRDVCKRLGIDAGASGLPRASTTESRDAHVLERISRLLALAESSNEHEAQAAMSAAQRLMLKHNLERVHDTVPRGYGFRHLGTPTGRVTEGERLLGAILGKHFFVEVIWVPVYRPLEQKQGSVLEVCGTPANLEMAAYVHAFLTHTAEQLWRTHKRAANIRRDRERRTFLAGVMTGFLEKLDQQRTLHKREGLVWVGDGDLDAYYRTRHPHIQHVRYAGNRRSEAHEHGRKAGGSIVLHRPVGGAAENRSRMLPPSTKR
jgi:predicted SprT family Zn-dependent metalloprotease